MLKQLMVAKKECFFLKINKTSKIFNVHFLNLHIWILLTNIWSLPILKNVKIINNNVQVQKIILERWRPSYKHIRIFSSKFSITFTKVSLLMNIVYVWMASFRSFNNRGLWTYIFDFSYLQRKTSHADRSGEQVGQWMLPNGESFASQQA